jgi:hypothetical protein
MLTYADPQPQAVAPAAGTAALSVLQWESGEGGAKCYKNEVDCIKGGNVCRYEP